MTEEKTKTEFFFGITEKRWNELHDILFPKGLLGMKIAHCLIVIRDAVSNETITLEEGIASSCSIGNMINSLKIGE